MSFKDKQKKLLRDLRKKRDEEAAKAKIDDIVVKHIINEKPKLLAPLKSYVIEKKFGTYFDKKRNIELFNEYVLLKTNIKNADVYNIKDGKVVYIKHNSSVLGNVVIIKHENNVYTIYSYLDKIVSSVRIGRSIKRGSVVGKVNDTFQFKATKNTSYIDPMGLLE